MGKIMSRVSCLVLGAALSIGAPALADTNTGYQLWNQGDYYGAVAQWRPAAVAGDPIAQYNLARAYQLGRGVPVDLKMAETWFGKAAAQGHQPSRDNYGLVLFQNGDRQSAMTYIDEAANRGDPRAQYVMGTALFNGDMVKKDWVRAYAMMTRASAAGIGAASSSLAQMDKYVPLDQRQRGLSLARTMESTASKPQFTSGMVGETVPPRSVVVPEDVPPSDVGAPSIPKPVKLAREKTSQPPVVKTPPVKVAVATSEPKSMVPKPAPAPKPASVFVVSSGGWRVQLGAFSNEANAKRAWSAVAGRLDGLNPSYVRASNVVRLQAGPLRDKAAAQRACAASGTSCLPVAP
jgi:cell division septation protein DedD